ncbi:hypothetical protein B0H63DRAFT_163588 [Podospora didyma]|uniref:Uncharacterized protein n=1 Tax=Podospora didyma TaxID=330526 RepID=A0AAE0NUI0_9PEZI|nr:hypothetical protein B0H63DRAFT_163588 [Podospora didyma]
MLKMHTLTANDMTAFVTGRCQQNKGYAVLKNLYPQQMALLARDIVSKAEGVFLWVSIVVNELPEYISEGRTMVDLQQTLETLPADTSGLYDATWARIPHHKLPNASVTMQIVKAAHGPLPWFLIWLADESRSATVNIDDFPLDSRPYAQQALSRRLATCTRGILEISSGFKLYVGFTHKTARDWANQPTAWQRLCSSYVSGCSHSPCRP